MILRLKRRFSDIEQENLKIGKSGYAPAWSLARRFALASLITIIALPPATTAMVNVPVVCADRPLYADIQVPRLIGHYVAERKRLRRLGFKSLKLRNPAWVWGDARGRTTRILPEAQYAVDVPVCNAYWRAPSGRVLKVSTCGDEQGGRIDAVGRAKPDDLASSWIKSGRG